MPLFSIVIPTFNATNFIDQTILSLLNQTNTDFETIVIDDGSTDGTYDKLLKYKARIRIVRQDNKGSTSARNLGIKYAQGEYIVSFDHDDILLPYALIIYKQVIEYLHHPPIISGKEKYFEKITEVEFNSWDGKNIYCTELECYFKKTHFAFFANSSLIIRKECLLKISGYSPNSFACDDARLMFRLGTETPLIKITYPTTFGYRVHDHNWSKNVDYIVNGALALIDDERRRILPGGKKMQFNRRGLIGTNVMSAIVNYVGMKNFKKILLLLIHLRSMIIIGFFRKFVSNFYLSERHNIKLDVEGK